MRTRGHCHHCVHSLSPLDHSLMLGMQATDLLSALTNNAGQTPLYTWLFSLELLSGKKIPVKELLSQNTSSDLFLSLIHLQHC